MKAQLNPETLEIVITMAWEEWLALPNGHAELEYLSITEEAMLRDLLLAAGSPEGLEV